MAPPSAVLPHRQLAAPQKQHQGCKVAPPPCPPLRPAILSLDKLGKPLLGPGLPLPSERDPLRGRQAGSFRLSGLHCAERLRGSRAARGAQAAAQTAATPPLTDHSLPIPALPLYNLRSAPIGCGACPSGWEFPGGGTVGPVSASASSGAGGGAERYRERRWGRPGFGGVRQVSSGRYRAMPPCLGHRGLTGYRRPSGGVPAGLEAARI